MSKAIALITLTGLAIALGAAGASAGGSKSPQGKVLHDPPSERTLMDPNIRSGVIPSFKKTQGMIKETRRPKVGIN